MRYFNDVIINYHIDATKTSYRKVHSFFEYVVVQVRLYVCAKFDR